MALIDQTAGKVILAANGSAPPAALDSRVDPHAGRESCCEHPSLIEYVADLIVNILFLKNALGRPLKRSISHFSPKHYDILLSKIKFEDH